MILSGSSSSPRSSSSLQLFLVPLMFIQLLAPPPLTRLAPHGDPCPARCECHRNSAPSPRSSAEDDDDQEEDDQPDDGGLSVRCLRGGINDTAFLALLQQLPADDVRELVVRAPQTAAGSNTFQWNDNINRLSRLSRLVLSGAAIPALSQAIRLPLLRELDLSGNSLEYIQLGSFLGMPMLERLDLSRNRLSVLPTGAFIYLKRLNALSLSHNRLGPELPMGGVLRGPRALRELELDGNRLSARQLNELLADLGGGGTLQRLEMNHLGLNDAEVWALNLSRVPEVRRVGLAGNNLTQVPSTTLRALALLDTVDLSDNLIRSLGPCAFCGCNISRVLLARNLLGLSPRPIHREAFADTRMRELDLSHNHLRGEFNSAQLHGAQETLEVLHLSGNGPLAMDSGALLSTLPALRALHLADCALGSVPYSLPKAYGHLTLLNLSGNGLDMLPPNMGTMLPQLRVLDLSRNIFSSLPHTLMPFVDRLELVYLHHCPWDCECAAQPLQVHMLRRLGHRELLRYEETLCAEPPMLRAQPLHRVQTINDCAILFGANYGITQNTELVLILVALLVAALVLSAALVASLYCGRHSGKQKGTYVTGEGIGDEVKDERDGKDGKMKMVVPDQDQLETTMMSGGMSRSTTLYSTGTVPAAGRTLIDLDVLAMNGDIVGHNNSNNNNNRDPLLPPISRTTHHHQQNGAGTNGHLADLTLFRSLPEGKSGQKEPLLVDHNFNEYNRRQHMVVSGTRHPMPPAVVQAKEAPTRTMVTF